MLIHGRKHNAEDIKATVLAVDPIKYVHRGRIAVFSVTVLREERMVIVAEQKSNCSEEESFQWMSHVLPAVDTVHTVGVYCLCLVSPNGLPKTSNGKVCTKETKFRFIEGSLHPVNVLMCPHTTVTNLPKPRQRYQGMALTLLEILSLQILKAVRNIGVALLVKYRKHIDQLDINSAYVFVCVCVCMCISFHFRGFLNNKCNARVQANDGMLWKCFPIKDLFLRIKDFHGKNLQGGNFTKECQLNRAKPREGKRNSYKLSKKNQW